jgi:hypothetical protein
VRAKADQADHTDREQADHGRRENLPALAPATRREHEKRQRQAGGDLDAHTNGECRRARAQSRARAGRERQRRGEHHHDQRVVVRSADGEHEQHRVQPDERGGPATGLAELAGRARHQRDRAEAGRCGDGFERPQPAGEPERRRRIAGEREQRSIGGVLIGPSDEPEDFVARSLRRHVRVWVQAVQRSEAREPEIAEDVLGDQRRPEQKNRVRRPDRRDDCPHRQAAREREHEQIAGAHDQRERLKRARAHRHTESLQRPCQPGRPAAAAPGHVLRRFAGGARGGEEDRRDDAQQAERAKRTRDRGGAARRRSAPGAQTVGRATGALKRRSGQGPGGRHRLIVTSTRGQACGGQCRIPR